MDMPKYHNDTFEPFKPKEEYPKNDKGSPEEGHYDTKVMIQQSEFDQLRSDVNRIMAYLELGDWSTSVELQQKRKGDEPSEKTRL